MRTSLAYFAGAGTVVAAIAVGLGGGLVIANVMNPNATRELGKVQLQMKAKQAELNVAQQAPQPDAAQASPKPSPSPSIASNASPTPAPYLAQVQPAAKAPVVVGAAPPKPQEKSQEKLQGKSQEQPQAKSEAANASPPAANAGEPPAKQNDVAATKTSAAPKAKRDDTPKVRQAEQTPSQAAPHDDDSAPENAYAKARDADLKRADDKRKSDHRQWASRRQQQQDDQMRDVEEQLRRDSGPREVYVERDDSDGPDYGRRPDYDRREARRPMGFDFPHVNFFGPDD